MDDGLAGCFGGDEFLFYDIIPDIMDVANAEKAKTIKTGTESVMRQILR